MHFCSENWCDDIVCADMFSVDMFCFFHKKVFSHLAGMSPYISLKNKEKTLRASYDRGTQIFDYME